MILEKAKKSNLEMDFSHLKLPIDKPKYNKKFSYSGSGKSVKLSSGTVTRLLSEGRE